MVEESLECNVYYDNILIGKSYINEQMFTCTYTYPDFPRPKKLKFWQIDFSDIFKGIDI